MLSVMYECDVNLVRARPGLVIQWIRLLDDKRALSRRSKMSLEKVFSKFTTRAELFLSRAELLLSSIVV